MTRVQNLKQAMRSWGIAVGALLGLVGQAQAAGEYQGSPKVA